MSTLPQPLGWISFFTMAIGTGPMRAVGTAPLVTTGHGSISSVNEYLLSSITCLRITAIYLRAINGFLTGTLRQTGKPGRTKGTGIDRSPSMIEDRATMSEEGEMIKGTVEAKGTAIIESREVPVFDIMAC